jgi:hypothetical protein
MNDETWEPLEIFGVAVTDLEAEAEKLAATAAQLSPAAVGTRLRSCCRMPRSSPVGIPGLLPYNRQPVGRCELVLIPP